MRYTASQFETKPGLAVPPRRCAPVPPQGGLIRWWAVAVVLVVLLLSAPAIARETAVLGTIPPYPGATRPLPHWETRELAIAMTKDKPPVIVDYYMKKMALSGWKPAPGIGAEALAAALAGEPAWLTFERTGFGQLELQVTAGKHPKTGEPVSLIFYQSNLKL